jgi:phage terminase large subunit-like protein
LKVGKGDDLKPFILRDWQVDLVASVMDADPVPRLAGWLIGRGNGKSTLLAAWAIYSLFTGGESASVVVCAVNQAQANLIFAAARRMVELSLELSERCQIGRERLLIPKTNAVFDCLPSTPAALEGLDASLILLDEAGVTPRELYEVLTLGQGKRPVSTLVAVGTPPPDPTDSVLTDLRQLHYELGDEFIAWREFSADEFKSTHPVDCLHCIKLANPAYGDFLAPDSFTTLVRTTRENSYRRSRLCQFVNDTNPNPFIDPDTWANLSTGEEIAEGTEVVLALDGSFGGKDADTTALLLATVSATPHFHPLRVWANTDNDPAWRVNVLEVEAEIRLARSRFQCRELVMDPFRWTRTGQILASEGMTVAEFPWSPSRVTKAVTDLHSSAYATPATISHSGDPTLTRHVLAATVVESDGGLKISKTSRKRSAEKIDLCAAMVMAHSRATWLATRTKKRRRAHSF